MATLTKFFQTNLFDIESAELLFKKYSKHKVDSDNFVSFFNEDSINTEAVLANLTALKENSIFYSFCFDYYKFLPIIIALQGYKVTVLVEDRIFNQQLSTISRIIQKFEDKIGKPIAVEFLPHNEQNIIYKLKSRINSNHKVLIFVDGNKGNKIKQDNLLKCQFKGVDIMFHQGFALLCYLLKQKTICGIICKKENGKLVIQSKSERFDCIEPDRSRYMNTISTLIVKDIDNTISLDNIYKWDALVSLYQWLPKSHEQSNYLADYIPFTIDNEHYILNKDTFLVTQIDKKMFKQLSKQYV